MTKPAKLTRNQETVLAALTGSDGPLTAYEILDRDSVRRRGVKAPLTIYRALERLLDYGLVHRIESLNAYLACSSGPHDEAVGFVICDECHQVTELHIDDCESHLAQSAGRSGFRVDTLRIEMTGRCSLCRRSEVRG